MDDICSLYKKCNRPGAQQLLLLAKPEGIQTSLAINNLNSTSTSMFNRTNFSNILFSGSSTLLSSLNVPGSSDLNILSGRGNLNDGRTTH
jgi:hypothetical protein